MIDVFSRFGQATLIPSKHKDMIVQAILKNWVSIFGVPQSIFSDNGGEFDNHLLRNVAELLGTRVITTAAYSPWSNGIIERHNAVLENMVLKLTDDSKCSVADALVWAFNCQECITQQSRVQSKSTGLWQNPPSPFSPYCQTSSSSFLYT